MSEKLQKGLDSNEKKVEWIEDALDSLQKETIRTILFKKAWDWLKKQLWIWDDKENETKNQSDKEDKTKNQSDKKDETENQSDKKDKDQKVPENQEGLDKEKKTYTNAKSGLTFNMYDQSDPRRWNKKKNGGTTMKQTGCLLTSAAVIHSMVDPSITPDFYRQHYAGKFPYTSVPEASNHKIEAKNLTIGSNTTKEILDHLKKWYPVNFMVHWPKNGHNGKNPYTQWQHYRTAVDVRGEESKEEIFIANTYDGKWAGWYPADKMFISLKEASLYTPTQV